jgi:CheY-like chemotaxis protein
LRRVLLIEDDTEQAEALQQVLETTPVEIDLAHSGAEGLEKVRKLRPTLVLCDIGLPDMDGNEVARRIRADPELRTTRLVALTAHATAGDKQASGDAGFDGYIVKPPPFEALEKLVSGECTKVEPPRQG